MDSITVELGADSDDRRRHAGHTDRRATATSAITTEEVAARASDDQLRDHLRPDGPYRARLRSRRRLRRRARDALGPTSPSWRRPATRSPRRATALPRAGQGRGSSAAPCATCCSGIPVTDVDIAVAGDSRSDGPRASRGARRRHLLALGSLRDLARPREPGAFRSISPNCAAPRSTRISRTATSRSTRWRLPPPATTLTDPYGGEGRTSTRRS